MRVWELLAYELAETGIKDLFGLMGHGNLRLISHLVEHYGTHYYSVRHESAAVAMADAYARVTGMVGVCTVSHGPGFTNAATALIEARKGGAPLVILAGDTGTMDKAHNQNIDQLRFAVGLDIELIGVHQPADTTVAARKAFDLARKERRPVIINLPTDVQERIFEQPLNGEGLHTHAASISPTPSPPDAVSIRAAADILGGAMRPLILAGRGAVYAGGRREIEALGDRIGALFATSALAKGFFAGNPFEIGIAGGFSNAAARRLMADADVALVLGASMNEWTTRGGRLLSPDCLVIRCDLDANVIAKQSCNCEIVADAAESARAIKEELEARGVQGAGFRAVVTKVSPAEHTKLKKSTDADKPNVVHPGRLVAALEHILPKEKTVVVDSGNFMGYPAMGLSVPDPQGFVFAQSFMSLGLSLSGAIGAAVARRDRLPVAVVGDGGLLMSIGELETAVRYRLPVLVVVMNDAAYGAEVYELEQLGLSANIAKFNDMDFAAIGRSFGAEGSSVRSLADLEHIRSWLDDPSGPLMLDCKIDPEVRPDYWEL